MEEGSIIKATSTGDHPEIAEYKIVTADGEAGQAGDELTASQIRSDGDGQPDDDEQWQWERADSNATDAEWVEINGANEKSYTTNKETEEGKYLRLKTTYNDNNDVTYEVTSEAVLIPYINDGNAKYEIKGDSKAGEILSAERSNDGNDPDGNNDESRTFQWQRLSSTADETTQWSDIEEANTSSYKITQNDEENLLRLSIEYTDDQGFETLLLINAGLIELQDDGQATYSINKVPSIGTTLEAVNEAEDPDGKSEGETSYQWQRWLQSEDLSSWEDIKEADRSSYTVTEDDEGLPLQLAIDYVDAQGFETSLIINAGTVPFRDDGQASYAIEGTTTIDSELNIVEVLDDPDGKDDESIAIQWQRLLESGWEEIKDETSEKYTVGKEDEGKKIRAIIQYTDNQDFTTSVNTNTETVEFRDDGKSEYEVEGELIIGGTIKAKRVTDDPDGNNDESRLIRWERWQEESWEEIENETSEIYTLTDRDEGEEIRLVISYEDMQGFGTNLIVAAGKVAFRNDGDAQYAIDGLPISGQTIRGKLIVNDPDGGSEKEAALKWEQLIEGNWTELDDQATEMRPSTELEGEQIRIKASYIDGEGFDTIVTSEPVTIEEPQQLIRFTKEQMGYQPGQSLGVPILWEANTQVIDLREFEIAIHFNSEYFTPTQEITIAEGLPKPTVQIIADDNNHDSDDKTDTILKLEWPNATEPLSKEGQNEVIRINFNTADRGYDEISGEPIKSKITLRAQPSLGYAINDHDDVMMMIRSLVRILLRLTMLFFSNWT